MVTTLLGQKRSMAYRYDDRGRRIPVTAVMVEPNLIIGIRTKDQNGYNAVVLGIGNKKHPKKPQIISLKKALSKGTKTSDESLIVPRSVKEARMETPSLAIGTRIAPHQVFHKGLLVKATGTSKGKGFAGVVKRWGFAGGPKTHGQSDRLRAPGSIGQATTPGRVYKGKHMAGHMGAATVTVRNLEVIEMDRTQNVVYLKGPIPGYTGALVKLTVTGKVRAYQPPPEEKPDEEALSPASPDSESKGEQGEAQGTQPGEKT